MRRVMLRRLTPKDELRPGSAIYFGERGVLEEGAEQGARVLTKPRLGTTPIAT